MDSVKTEQQKVDERRKYISAFNSTMITIWKERISLLGVFDKGTLYRSVLASKYVMNPDASQFELEQSFLTYGIFQNFGTGKEIPRGNPGDIGRPKVRKARHWFDKKYYASVMNLRDFFTENLSQQYLAMMSNALSDRSLRESVRID